MTFQILDDITNQEKNMQMHNLNDPRDLVDKPDMVREWDTEKSERMEKAFRKCYIDNANKIYINKFTKTMF